MNPTLQEFAEFVGCCLAHLWLCERDVLYCPPPQQSALRSQIATQADAGAVAESHSVSDIGVT